MPGATDSNKVNCTVRSRSGRESAIPRSGIGENGSDAKRRLRTGSGATAGVEGDTGNGCGLADSWRGWRFDDRYRSQRRSRRDASGPHATVRATLGGIKSFANCTIYNSIDVRVRTAVASGHSYLYDARKLPPVRRVVSPTVVALAVVAAALAPLLVRRRLRGFARWFGAVAGRRNRRRAALAGALAALPLAVRYGGLLCERFLPRLSHDAVVALWYPVLVVGVPLAAVGFGRRLPPAEAGALAALDVGAGSLLDYAALGMAVLPVPVAVHRVGVATAVGLLAAGAGPDDGAKTRGQTASERGVASGDETDDRRWTAAFRAGAALWVVVVVAGHLVRAADFWPRPPTVRS
jgi:hypothetical protein